MGTHRSYSEGSTLYVVGEAINGSKTPVYNLTIIATFYDTAGNLVGATEALTFLPQTLPTQANPFKLQLSNAPSTVHSYELRVRWDELTLRSYDRATITREEVHQESGTQIVGDIRNDHRSVLQDLNVVATFYDETGAVLEVVTGRSSTTDLEPNATATFSIQSRQNIAFDSYLVQIEGVLFR